MNPISRKSPKTSSTMPKIGMRSGMRSIGEMVYMACAIQATIAGITSVFLVASIFPCRNHRKKRANLHELHSENDSAHCKLNDSKNGDRFGLEHLKLLHFRC